MDENMIPMIGMGPGQSTQQRRVSRSKSGFDASSTISMRSGSNSMNATPRGIHLPPIDHHAPHRITSLLALTAALAGCGGGTEKSTAPTTPAPPPPSGHRQQASSPTPKANVFDRAHWALNVRRASMAANANNLTVTFTTTASSVGRCRSPEQQQLATSLNPTATPTGAVRIHGHGRVTTPPPPLPAMCAPLPNRLELLVPPASAPAPMRQPGRHSPTAPPATPMWR